MPEFAIRNYHPSDMYMLYRICLETGEDGGDATGTIDREILGHFFAAPYAVVEPDVCFVLTADGAPCGYIVGTSDSRRFEAECQEKWWPPLREKYPLRDASDKTREAGMIRAIHYGYRAPAYTDEYPAHLHIDILPVGQGAGQGPRLIEIFLDKLRDKGVPGIHLGVSKGNERAFAFYPKLGFAPVTESETSIVYGMKL
ncbi:MAG TPA: GNAT family N-acetyltransferase [Pseudomonadales bacterium]|nr:GNAT family N-acetyltransferase [Pseudomonadales bacterium]